MKLYVCSAVILGLLSVTTNAAESTSINKDAKPYRASAKAYLGKDGDSKEDVIHKRDPVNIFIHENQNRNHESVEQFWQELPKTSNDIDFMPPPRGAKNLLNKRKGLTELKEPKGKLVHGISNHVQLLDELEHDKYIFDSNQRKSLYTKSKEGWSEYNEQRSIFTEFVPQSINQMAKYNESSFEKVLLNYANKNFNYIIPYKLNDLKFKSNRYDVLADNGLIVTDICATETLYGQTAVSRIWMTSDNDVIKFITFETNRCLLK